MSEAKISSVILYIIAALSLVVILFFYVAPKMVGNYTELETRYEEVTTGADMQVTEPETTVTDTTAADSLVAESDSASMAMATEYVEPMEAEVVPTEIDLKDHFSGWELMVLNRTDYALIWAYILVLLTAIAAIVFPLINVVTNMKALVSTLALLAGAAVLILISYFVLASDVPINIPGYAGTDNSDPVTLKWVDTGLFSTYVLFGLALLSILYSEVVSLFK